MSAELREWVGRTDAPVIVATGAVNALGFNAEQTWAFWRAETTPWAESPFHAANGVKAPMALDRTLPPRCFGAERMWMMTMRSLDQLNALGVLAPLRGTIFVGLPERFAQPAFERQRRHYEASLRSWLAQFLPDVMPRFVLEGHASLAPIIAKAGVLLDEGLIDYAIVGGADTYYDPLTIGVLNRQGRLFDTIDFDTILAGEAAAFAVLCSPRLARERGLEPYARLDAVAVAEEPASLHTDLPCAGRGLASAMRGITQTLKAARTQLDWVLGDCTNEVYRTHELGLALPRALAPGGLDTAGADFFEIASEQLDYDFLPECFGEIGAASLATAAVVGAEALRRGHPVARNVMLFGSSEGTTRGALLLSQPGHSAWGGA